jgi:transcriptional regulator GlxA family with amidase domain
MRAKLAEAAHMTPREFARTFAAAITLSQE